MPVDAFVLENPQPELQASNMHAINNIFGQIPNIDGDIIGCVYLDR